VSVSARNCVKFSITRESTGGENGLVVEAEVTRKPKAATLIAADECVRNWPHAARGTCMVFLSSGAFSRMSGSINSQQTHDNA